MSEHQHYEFLVLDRSLSAKEQAKLRQLSSRAEISAHRFCNVYNYGDLSARPEDLLAKHFDVFVYAANWGSHHLMLRLPASVFETELAEPFSVEDGLRVWRRGKSVLVEWRSEDEDGDWEDMTGWMSALQGLREELIDGDLRPLYIGWLARLASAVDLEELEPEAAVLPPPPGLAALTPPQKALVKFLRLDPMVLEEAASIAAPVAVEPGWDELVEAVIALPVEEKEHWLIRLFEGEEPHLSALFTKRLCEGKEAQAAAQPATGTVSELLERAGVRRRKREAEQKRQRVQKAAERKKKRLDALEAREEEAWREVKANIDKKQVTAYDKAVKTLQRLREVAVRRDQEAAFLERLRGMLAGFTRRPALMSRLERARLQ